MCHYIPVWCDSPRVSGISVFSEDIKRITPNSLYMQTCNLIPNNWPRGSVARPYSHSGDLNSTFSSVLMLCSWWLHTKKKRVRTCIATTFTLTTSPIHPLSLFGSLNFFFFPRQHSSLFIRDRVSVATSDAAAWLRLWLTLEVLMGIEATWEWY